jgi:hypothetical protein
VADTVPDIQYRIKIHIHVGRIHRGGDTPVDIQWQKQWRIYNTANTVADTQQQIHCGRYKTADIQRWIYSADTAVDIQHSRHTGRYTMADIYTVADIQPDIQHQVRIHIHSGGYTEVIQDTSTIYTAADTQWWIHSSGYTAADIQWRMNSSRYSSGYTTQ